MRYKHWDSLTKPVPEGYQQVTHGSKEAKSKTVNKSSAAPNTPKPGAGKRKPHG